MLARRRALTACAGAALAIAVGGCASTTAASTTVTGGTLSVYLSVPPGTLSPEAQDVISAEKLAFQQAGSRIGKFTIKLVPFSGNKVSANARQAIGDSTSIAYVGEIPPGASEDTIGITNAEDLLQVSPTDTAVEETQQTPAIANSPDRYYESLSTYNRTFARVVPTDALEAKFLVSQMQSLGVSRLYIKADGSDYGAALADAVRGDAPSLVVGSQSGADGILYAGGNEAGATALFDQAVSGDPSVKLFAPSALELNSFAAALSPAAQRDLYVSSPGFTSSDLPPLGKQFDSAFKAAYGHAPAIEAIFGYEAMSAVMAVLREAGSSAANRSTVVHKFFAIRNRVSALGTYSINHNGDTSIAPFVLSRVRAGALVPYKAVPDQG